MMYALGAAVAFALAAVVLFSARLPERAAYTALFYAPDARPVAAELNAYAPPLRGSTLDASSFDLTALRGETVILNFWASWCIPCQVEMPALQQLHEEGLRVVAINLGEDRATVAAWVQAYGLTYDIVLDDGRAAANYRLRGQPTTVIVTPDGVIRQIFHGPVEINALRGALG